MSVFLDGNLNQHLYRVILDETLLPFGRDTFQHNFVFQDDNARPTKLSTWTGQECRLIWTPSNISGPNWHWCIDNMDQQPTSVHQLRQFLINAWSANNCAIPVRTLRNLESSMPARVRALMNTRGAHAKYRLNCAIFYYNITKRWMT